MKILQVNVVYAKGSTGKIVADVHSELIAQNCGSLVAYGRGSRVSGNNVYKFCTELEAAVQKVYNRLGGLMYGGSFLSTLRLIEYIKRERPDIVHLHCINGYCVNIYKLLNVLAKQRIRTIVTHHAEFFYTGNCGHALECNRFMDNPGCRDCPRPKAATGALLCNRASKAWMKMKKAFACFDKDMLVFTAVSPWLAERAKLSSVVEGRECIVVENGIDTMVFNHSQDFMVGRSLITNCKSKMILHVTASFSDAKDSFKGGDSIVALARMMPNVTFVIAASYSSVSGSLPDNIVLFGRTRDQQELATLYNAADLTIIASKRETFSMIVAESLCCGTPVVGYKAGGPESIAISDYCSFVDYGDLSALKSAAEIMLGKDYDRDEISRRAKAKFDRKVMANNYMKIYKSMLS